jgi:hypothetical protein
VSEKGGWREYSPDPNGAVLSRFSGLNVEGHNVRKSDSPKRRIHRYGMNQGTFDL